MNDPKIFDDCLEVGSNHWSRLELRTHHAFAAVYFKASLLLYQIITSLVVGFTARNRVEAEGFMWIRHMSEEIISSSYSPLHLPTNAYEAASHRPTGEYSAHPRYRHRVPCVLRVILRYPNCIVPDTRGSLGFVTRAACERVGKGERERDGTEDEEWESVIRALERVVFPPAAVGHGHAWEEMEVEVVYNSVMFQCRFAYSSSSMRELLT
ncbi:hypothetical protein B0H16DRAFT_1686024 [Mycena metata]|uniref:Uncharacterized protein n=1 Tax=Mycena metata TaxID=1033252 RepID=A0AAD7JTE5_9AGAR|nr:hypothetical protein B0H16DRAFT_1686024 [Mycena metata]